MRSPVTTPWHPAGWQAKPAQQQPKYADQAALDHVVAQLARLPPIVVSWEIDALRERLAAAQRGQAFLLQGGDCAETFADCESDQIAKKLKILLQMSLVLLHGLKKPIIRVGRMAGQYAKPRSADTETQDGVTLPSYRGDLVNRPEFTAEAREPDPKLLLRGYERAALTLNFVRALVDGGFADLHHPEYWDLGFVQSLAAEGGLRAHRRLDRRRAGFLRRHERPPRARSHARRLSTRATKACICCTSRRRRASSRASSAGTTCPRTCRGSACARRSSTARTSNTSAASRIRSRVKIGAAMDASWLQGLVVTLNPQNQPGRLTLIHRFGAKDVEKSLPRAIEAVRQTGQQVLWVCDPMHGNTETSTGGLKTRRFENILRELELAFQIHSQCGSHLGGVHIELTGEDVTECTGGARGLTDTDLQRAYRSQRRSAPESRAGAGAGAAGRRAQPADRRAALAVKNCRDLNSALTAACRCDRAPLSCRAHRGTP